MSVQTMMAKAGRAQPSSSREGPMIYCASPTFTQFHACDLLVRAVMGPVGSGKSVGMCMEVLSRARAQAPYNGVRRTRWAVIRSSYRELKTTTIATFRQWLGHLGRFTWDSPIRFNADFPLDDGTRVEMEVLFFPLDKPEDIESLKSLELTGVWINEAISLDPKALQVLRGRIRRYPAEWEGGFTWSGIIMDTNPPPVEHWFYRLFELDKPAGHKLFRQPPPLFRNADGTYSPNPAAENIENHAAGYHYYFDQIPGADDEYVKVFVLGEYGSVHSGKPVFRSFSERKHVARQPLVAHRSASIVVGMDFGLNPACVFGQMNPSGQLLVVDELVGDNTLLDEFLDEGLVPKLVNDYPGFSVVVSGDPTGVNRSSLGALNSFQMVQARGIAAEPAASNDLDLRLQAVGHYLSRSDGFLIDRKCERLIDALAGGYQLARAANGFYKPVPKKDGPSHVADGLQYLCLYFYRGAIRAATREKPSLRRVRTAPSRRPFAYV